MAIYRVNRALPPSARSKEEAYSLLVLEAAIRRLESELGDGGFASALARHALSAASHSDLAAEVLYRARRVLDATRLPSAPLGSGRRFARDKGGRVMLALSPWEESFLSSLRGTRALGALVPYDRGARAVWALANRAVEAAIRRLESATWRADPDCLAVRAAVEAAEAAASVMVGGGASAPPSFSEELAEVLAD